MSAPRARSKAPSSLPAQSSPQLAHHQPLPPLGPAAHEPPPSIPGAAAATHVADAALLRVRDALQHGIVLRQRLLAEESQQLLIATAAARITACLRSGGKLLICGNGGSAADAQHIAAELTGRFSKAPRRGLAAIALTTDTSALTAIANDFSFAEIFSRQVEALGRPGDVLLAISTSGSSANVLRAATLGRSLGLLVIALTGEADSPLGQESDLCLRTPGTTSERIQELHITIGHILCDLVDAAFCSPAPVGAAGAR